VLSEHANDSPHVERELESALGRRLPLLPFRIDDVPLSENMQFYIRVHHWMEAAEPPIEDHLHRLAEAARRWLGGGGMPGGAADQQLTQQSPGRATRGPRIITQVVSISYSNDGRGGDGLIYRQAPLTFGHDPPPPLGSRVPWPLIRNHIRQI